MRGCGERGEGGEGLEVAEVVCECFLGEEDLSDGWGDFAMAYYHNTRCISYTPSSTRE